MTSTQAFDVPLLLQPPSIFWYIYLFSFRTQNLILTFATQSDLVQTFPRINAKRLKSAFDKIIHNFLDFQTFNDLTNCCTSLLTSLNIKISLVPTDIKCQSIDVIPTCYTCQQGIPFTPMYDCDQNNKYIPLLLLHTTHQWKYKMKWNYWATLISL